MAEKFPINDPDKFYAYLFPRMVDECMAEEFQNHVDKTIIMPFKTEVESVIREKEVESKENEEKQTDKNHGNDTKKDPPSKYSDSEMNCLDIFEKLVSKFKSGDTVFVNLLGDLCNIYNCKNTKKQKLKTEVIENLVLNIAQADIQEMKTLKKELKYIFVDESIKKKFVDDKDLLILGLKGEFVLGQLKINGVNTPVNLRIASDNTFDIKLLRNEAMILSKLDHPNIYDMIGITRNFNTIIFEIDGYENLKKLLFQREFSNNSRKIIDMLIKIAETMVYIHSQDILHNTLNTMNIRIKNENIKIDMRRFSFAGYVRDSKIDRETFLGACYSSAPESINNDIYTTKTDVWAMGILCFEVFFYLSVPLITLDLEIALLSIFDSIQKGSIKFYRPNKCPKPLFSYMSEKLLNVNPEDRHSFTEIVTALQDLRRRC